jgi:hypothetical protein
MAFDLTSESGQTRSYNGAAWSLLLAVGEAYGWEPAGTTPPPGQNGATWSGDYDTNDGQGVTRDDAAAFARALGAALRDPERRRRQIEVSRALHRAVHAMEVEMFGEEEIGPYVEDPDPQGIDDDVLRDAIEFLNAGSFRID